MISACNKEYQKGRLSGREAEGSQPASARHEELKRSPFVSHLTSSTSCILSVADVAFEIHLEELKGSSRHLLYRLICKHTFKNFTLLMIPLICSLLRQQRIFNEFELLLYPTPSSSSAGLLAFRVRSDPWSGSIKDNCWAKFSLVAILTESEERIFLTWNRPSSS